MPLNLTRWAWDAALRKAQGGNPASLAKMIEHGPVPEDLRCAVALCVANPVHKPKADGRPLALTPLQVWAIRFDHEDGLSVPRLMLKYNKSDSVIRRALKEAPAKT